MTVRLVSISENYYDKPAYKSHDRATCGQADLQVDKNSRTGAARNRQIGTALNEQQPLLVDRVVTTPAT